MILVDYFSWRETRVTTRPEMFQGRRHVAALAMKASARDERLDEALLLLVAVARAGAVVVVVVVVVGQGFSL